MNETRTEAPARLVIRRTFSAPRARVYAAFTEPDRMRHWAGPEGFTVPEAHFDARVGGTYSEGGWNSALGKLAAYLEANGA